MNFSLEVWLITPFLIFLAMILNVTIRRILNVGAIP